MNRREAIKNISISFGSITLSTGVLSMIQSCQTDNIDWSPDYFKKNQINFIDRIFELIIPETDTPGAISLNLSRFVDDASNIVMYFYYDLEYIHSIKCMIHQIVSYSSDMVVVNLK